MVDAPTTLTSATHLKLLGANCSSCVLRSNAYIFLQVNPLQKAGMTRYAPSLAHTLAEVPELLPWCLTTWESQSAGIRQLRLVSKETGCAALHAVYSCSLEIGEGASPGPHRAVQLFSYAHLEVLKLTILIKSGELSAQISVKKN